MAGIGGSIEAEVEQIAQEEVNKIADKALELLVKETETDMAGYYSNIGPGTMYERTWQFFDAYSEINNRNGMVATVGINFDQTPDYPIHGRSVSSEDIYDWNLEGQHGSLGNSGDIAANLDAYAASLNV